MPNRQTARGFTLVECAVVCAVIGVLSAVALPSWRGHTLRAARLDAVDALTRVQIAQEQHRSAHGLYAADVTPLTGVGSASRQGLYRLQITSTGPDSYRASATAIGTQAQDSGCAALTLDVDHGFAQPGPSTQCWAR